MGLDEDLHGLEVCESASLINNQLRLLLPWSLGPRNHMEPGPLVVHHTTSIPPSTGNHHRFPTLPASRPIMGKQNNANADSVNASVSKIDATDAYQFSRLEAETGMENHHF